VIERPAKPVIQPKKAVRMKVVSMGDAAVGKSCLIKRYCERRFVSKYITTIGVDFGVKPAEVKGREVKVNFWDLAGPKEYFDVRNEFYKDSQGALLVYDVSSRPTFESLDTWMAEALKHGAPKDMVVYVCANKSDKMKREVTEKEGRVWAQRRGFKFFQTSANSGEGVDDMFEGIFAEVYERFFSFTEDIL